MAEPGEEDEVPRSYADLFVARLGRIVGSTEIATFRIEEDFNGPELNPVSYFRTSDVSLVFASVESYSTMTRAENERVN